MTPEQEAEIRKAWQPSFDDPDASLLDSVIHVKALLSELSRLRGVNERMGKATDKFMKAYSGVCLQCDDTGYKSERYYAKHNGTCPLEPSVRELMQVLTDSDQEAGR